MATSAKRPAPQLVERAILPAPVSSRLLADADAIASRMARRIASEMPEVGTPLPLGGLRDVVAACRDALRVLVRRLHDGRGPRPGDLDRLALVGARQADLGIPLDLLLAAYRVAAKVVWEEVVGSVARDEAMPADTLIAIASQIFDYLDQISGAVGAAYLERRERLLRQRDRDRERVLQRLLAGDDADDVHRAAVAAELRLEPPYRLLAAAPSGDVDTLLDRVWRPAGVLAAGADAGLWLLLVPGAVDLPRLCAESRAADPQLHLGIGPVAASLGEVAAAARRARTALLVGRRLDADAALHDDAEVGVFAALDSDRPALRHFVDVVLGQVSAASPSRAREMLATLEAVVATSGLGEAAERLGVHRHTVVYRLQRLRELGIDVDDPRRRHLIWLALRARRLLANEAS